MRAVVCDFGLARLRAAAASKGFTTQELGPVRWEAPESLERREYSEASDAYALGCVLHELSARGETPWPPSWRATAVAHAVLSGKRPAPWACSPPALAFWRRRCFEARPADRPAVAAVAEGLRAAIARNAAAASALEAAKQRVGRLQAGTRCGKVAASGRVKAKRAFLADDLRRLGVARRPAAATSFERCRPGNFTKDRHRRAP